MLCSRLGAETYRFCVSGMRDHSRPIECPPPQAFAMTRRHFRTDTCPCFWNRGGVVMLLRYPPTWFAGLALVSVLWGLGTSADAQLTDITQTPNRANAGIQKSLEEQIG